MHLQAKIADLLEVIDVGWREILVAQSTEEGGVSGCGKRSRGVGWLILSTGSFGVNLVIQEIKGNVNEAIPARFDVALQPLSRRRVALRQ
jgi:hypothetical protein